MSTSRTAIRRNIAVDSSKLCHIDFAHAQEIHKIIHSPIHIKAFPTDFRSLTLETSPTTSSTNAIAAPSLLLKGTKSVMLHRMSNTPTSSRSVLE